MRLDVECDDRARARRRAVFLGEEVVDAET
jgi:hypothetical protein